MTDSADEQVVVWSGRGFLSPTVGAILVAIPAGIYMGLARADVALVGIFVALPVILAFASLLWVRVDVTTQV